MAVFPWSLPIRASYALWRKNYTGGIVARLRAFWHHVVRGYRYEVCGECGRPVEQVWNAPDELWQEVMGWPGGLLCIRCFDAKLEDRPGWVLWEPKVMDR